MFIPRSFSLVVFRLVDPTGVIERENDLNQAFMRRVNKERGIMLTDEGWWEGLRENGGW